MVYYTIYSLYVTIYNVLCYSILYNIPSAMLQYTMYSAMVYYTIYSPYVTMYKVLCYGIIYNIIFNTICHNIQCTLL